MSEPAPGAAAGRNARAPTISTRDDLAVAHVAARRGKTPELRERARALLGVALPEAPRLAGTVSRMIVWAGPDQWLVMEPRKPDADASTELAKAFNGLASVVDVSDARVIFEASGPSVADALSKGIPVDLDPRVFKAGDVAITQAAHLGVLLWRSEDGLAYYLACARTYAVDFRHWLDATLAAAGHAA